MDQLKKVNMKENAPYRRVKIFFRWFNSGIVEKSDANHALEVTKILVEASRQIK